MSDYRSCEKELANILCKNNKEYFDFLKQTSEGSKNVESDFSTA